MSPSRFCSSCGQPAIAIATHCTRCGAVLVVPPAATRAAKDGKRSSAPSWLIGLLACFGGGMVFLVCGGIIAAIAIPNLIKSQTKAKVAAAEPNLRSLWAAQQSYRIQNGDYLEFWADKHDQSELAPLGVKIDGAAHAYEGFWDGDVFVLTARGNMDDDYFEDEWELTSDDPTPQHIADDVSDRTNYGTGYGSGATGGGVSGGTVAGYATPVPTTTYGYGGLGTSGSTPTLDLAEAEKTAQKSDTARTNLEAIWEGQKAYKLVKKQYLGFSDGGFSTWTALGMDDLPTGHHHTFSATLSGGVLTLKATGNLDSDAFEDEWTLSSADGIAVQVRNDALNLDLTELAGVLKDLEMKGKTQ